MEEPEVILEKSAKVGSSVVVEHKRGSGTRDQDKVKVKNHGASMNIDDLREDAVDTAIQSMEDLREANKVMDDGE